MCAEPSCDRRRHHRQDFCKAHGAQLRRRGFVGPLRPFMLNEICRADDCNRPATARWLCKKHHRRARTHGDPNMVLQPWTPRSEWHLNTDIGYAAAHSRIIGTFGAAAGNPCVQCGGPAREWAYDGTDPAEKYGPTRSGYHCFYSVYPEFYMPMCVKCHRSRDSSQAAEELYEYRTWRIANPGKTLANA